MSVENKADPTNYIHGSTVSKPASKKFSLYRTWDNKNYNEPVQKSTYNVVMSKEDNCPQCGEKPVKFCYCVNSDKRCSNNHVWYIDREGNYISKDPHSKQ